MQFDMEIPTCREGVFVPVPFAGPKEIVRIVQRAERLGYNAVWGTDFITPTRDYRIPDAQPPKWYELLISLAYCAAVTDRIKLGAGVILIPYRDPVILAKQAATLDQFSNGRFLLGLGLGGYRQEFEAIRPRRRKAHRGKIMDECLEALSLLLGHDEGEVSFQGKYEEFHGVNLHPRPVQNPLPIYVPGRAPQSLRRVARWGLGFMVPVAMVGQRIDALRPVLEEHGRDISQIDVVAEADLHLARTHEAAVERYRNTRHGQFRARVQDIDSAVAANWVGTPDEAVEKISKVKEQGITHFNALHIAGDTVEEMLEQMETFAKEVIPKVG